MGSLMRSKGILQPSFSRFPGMNSRSHTVVQDHRRGYCDPDRDSRCGSAGHVLRAETRGALSLIVAAVNEFRRDVFESSGRFGVISTDFLAMLSW